MLGVGGLLLLGGDLADGVDEVLDELFLLEDVLAVGVVGGIRVDPVGFGREVQCSDVDVFVWLFGGSRIVQLFIFKLNLQRIVSFAMVHFHVRLPVILETAVLSQKQYTSASRFEFIRKKNVFFHYLKC